MVCYPVAARVKMSANRCSFRGVAMKGVNITAIKVWMPLRLGGKKGRSR